FVGNVPTCGITGKVVPSCGLAQFGYSVPSDGPLQIVTILEIVAQTSDIGADPILGDTTPRGLGPIGPGHQVFVVELIQKVCTRSKETLDLVFLEFHNRSCRNIVGIGYTGVVIKDVLGVPTQ